MRIVVGVRTRRWLLEIAPYERRCNVNLADRLDMVWLAEGFANAIAAHKGQGIADAWAQAYFEVASGGFALFDRGDGGCGALTRIGAGPLCLNKAMPGEVVCTLHHRLMRQREDA